MTPAEMIEKYEIKLHGADMINARRVSKATASEIAAIKAAKAEIVAELQERKNIEAQRLARIASIPGLDEMRDYKEALNAWYYRHAHATENEDYQAFTSKPQKPEGDFAQAEAYLALRAMTHTGSHFAKVSAGTAGIEAIKDGADPIDALNAAKAQWAKYCEDHVWD